MAQTRVWFVCSDSTGCMVPFVLGLMWLPGFALSVNTWRSFTPTCDARGRVVVVIFCLCQLGLQFMASLSYFVAMTTDPGAVPLTSTPEEAGLPEGTKRCDKCKCFKPPRAAHCSECKRCILKMDHHCPWVNNCVGAYNQKTFMLFCGYTCIAASHFALICNVLGMHYSTWVPNLLRQAHRKQEVGAVEEVYKSLWLGHCPAYWGACQASFMPVHMYCALFAAFTFGMLTSQIDSIWHGVTGIEELKNRRSGPVPHGAALGWPGLELTMGGPVSIHWFIPTSVRRSDEVTTGAFVRNVLTDMWQPLRLVTRRFRATSTAACGGLWCCKRRRAK